MERFKRSAYIRSQLSEAALYEGLAEEATELAHAAQKMARIKRGENPTPSQESEVILNLIEEFSDVQLYTEVLGLSVSDTVISDKFKRWCRRLQFAEDLE